MCFKKCVELNSPMFLLVMTCTLFLLLRDSSYRIKTLMYTVKNYLHGLHGFVASSQKFVVSNRPRGNPNGVNFQGVSSKQFVPNFTVTVYFTTLSLE